MEVTIVVDRFAEGRIEPYRKGVTARCCSPPVSDQMEEPNGAGIVREFAGAAQVGRDPQRLHASVHVFQACCDRLDVVEVAGYIHHVVHRLRQVGHRLHWIIFEEDPFQRVYM
ncbi:hypothetical protein N9L68_00805 [bacterium]|nr:hypothetical protein [bacterium]